MRQLSILCWDNTDKKTSSLRLFICLFCSHFTQKQKKSTYFSISLSARGNQGNDAQLQNCWFFTTEDLPDVFPSMVNFTVDWAQIKWYASQRRLGFNSMNKMNMIFVKILCVKLKSPLIKCYGGFSFKVEIGNLFCYSGFQKCLKSRDKSAVIYPRRKSNGSHAQNQS